MVTDYNLNSSFLKDANIVSCCCFCVKPCEFLVCGIERACVLVVLVLPGILQDSAP